MTAEETAVKIAEHQKEIGSLKHRVDALEDKTGNLQGLFHRTSALEERTEVIQGLALSVNELAINMKAMLAEQEKQGKKIESLESVPAKRWDTVQTVIITALASGLITYILTRIF